MNKPIAFTVLLATGLSLAAMGANNGSGGVTARSAPVLLQVSDSYCTSEADFLDARFRSMEKSDGIPLITTRRRAFHVMYR